jgi:hypothetical protein
MSLAIATQLAPSGWYPDPAGSVLLRWWDGSKWTSQLQAAPSSTGTGYAVHRLPKPRF